MQKNRRPGIYSKILNALIGVMIVTGMWVVIPTPAAQAVTQVVNTTADSGTGSLREAIASAEPGEMIEFSPQLAGETITLTSTLKISKTLTINGFGLGVPIIISGNNAVGVISIDSGAEVSLRGLKITRGRSTNGGGIQNEGTLKLTGCDITDNAAESMGGGIFNPQGRIVIKNSVIFNNKAGKDGGGISNLGTIQLISSSLSGNIAEINGGGIDNNGTLTIVGNTFNGNSAGDSGGGINSSNILVVSTSLFSENNAMEGGALKNLGTTTVTESTFSGNNAENGGGIENRKGILDITASTLSGNSAKFGGGIRNDYGTLTLTAVILTANNAGRTGGGLDIHGGSINLTTTSVSDNSAAVGGGISNLGGKLTIAESEISDNMASSQGGGVNNQTGTLELLKTKITGNTSVGYPGGGICNIFSTLKVVESLLYRNRTSYLGGGIFNYDSILIVANSTFSGNSADDHGGGIVNLSGNANIINSTLYNNLAGKAGGIYNTSPFSGRSAGDDGIYTRPNPPRVLVSALEEENPEPVSTNLDRSEVPGSLNIANTIISFSTGGDCVNEDTTGININNLITDGSCKASLKGDPKLGPLANNGGNTRTHAFLPGSPVKNAGDHGTCNNTVDAGGAGGIDQRGFTRFWGGSACDIGAFEGDILPRLGGFATYLPLAGFTPGRVTFLPEQPGSSPYTDTGMSLEIPTLNVSSPIVSVYRGEYSWDVSFLGDKAGYLKDSAYPTQAGNTVIAGHLSNPDKTPGIFSELESLNAGDQFFIHSLGQTFTYEVRENTLVNLYSVNDVFRTEVDDWVTLMTCESYDPTHDAFSDRRIVRAVLISVE